MSILLVNGNAERIPLADESVHAVVTSPPYYGLRKYAIDGDAEIGLEDTPEAYLERMVAVFREVRRVLRDDGVAWVNMGDSYGHGTKSVRQISQTSTKVSESQHEAQGSRHGGEALQLMNIPARLVLALQADGWYHRSTIIWAKPNPMPESVSGWRWERHKVKVSNSKHATDNNIKGGYKKMLEDASVHQGMSPDFLAEWSNCPGCAKCAPNNGLILRRGSWRPTTAHEYIFMLTKTSDYFADGEAVREGVKPESIDRCRAGFMGNDPDRDAANNYGDGFMRGNGYEISSRNARTVWDFPTQPYPGSHFATYPEELPRRCLKASISDQGCCPVCGSQWARVVEKGYRAPAQEDIIAEMVAKGVPRQKANLYGNPTRAPELYAADPDKTIGFLPTCTCPPHEPVPAVVFDPFCGSGTTGIVARELGAHFIGLDLSYPYLHDQARDRLGLTALDAWAQGKGKQDGKVISDLPLFEVKV